MDQWDVDCGDTLHVTPAPSPSKVARLAIATHGAPPEEIPWTDPLITNRTFDLPLTVCHYNYSGSGFCSNEHTIYHSILSTSVIHSVIPCSPSPTATYFVKKMFFSFYDIANDDIFGLKSSFPIPKCIHFSQRTILYISSTIFYIGGHLCKCTGTLSSSKRIDSIWTVIIFPLCHIKYYASYCQVNGQ